MLSREATNTNFIVFGLTQPVQLINTLYDSISDNKSLLESADGFIFHSPYCKLVQKSFARLMLNDLWNDPDPDFTQKYCGLEGYR
jgi:3-hydroxy-3-methylglutaryl CoA synthase